LKLPMTKPANDPKADGTLSDSLPLESVIRTGVLTALGRPPEMYRVVVFPLWGNHYRVNVLTGPDAISVRIRHSYFVIAGDDGDIVSSVPDITRLYV
jgi:hypothetical protein